ncbi:MAG: hypothetical protein LC660_00040 [Desulfobacteraceae bacterium]|nr:hypothetical protein [Desulfobacteraceae bacterium]
MIQSIREIPGFLALVPVQCFTGQLAAADSRDSRAAAGTGAVTTRR